MNTNNTKPNSNDMLSEWMQGKHDERDVIEFACEKGDDLIVEELMKMIGYGNVVLNKFVMDTALLHNRKDLCIFMTGKGPQPSEIAIAAAKDGNINLVRHLIDSGFGQDLEPSGFKMAATDAAIAGDLDLLKTIMDVGRDFTETEIGVFA